VCARVRAVVCVHVCVQVGRGMCAGRGDIDSGSGLRSLGDARGKLGVQRECVEVDVLRRLREVPGWCVRGLACGEAEKLIGSSLELVFSKFNVFSQWF